MRSRSLNGLGVIRTVSGSRLEAAHLNEQLSAAQKSIVTRRRESVRSGRPEFPEFLRTPELPLCDSACEKRCRASRWKNAHTGRTLIVDREEDCIARSLGDAFFPQPKVHVGRDAKL